jgi:hypothetical protein
MGPDTQTLLYECATLVACLCGEARIHSNHLMSGTCSLGFKDSEKRAPGGIHDGFREVVVLDHVANAQILNGNVMVLLSILSGNFEMMISTLATDLQVRFCHIASSFPPSLGAFLASRKLTLFAPQDLTRGTIKARVRNSMAFRVSEERLQPNVNADVRMSTGRREVFGFLYCFTHNQGIPVPIGSMDKVDGFGGTQGGTVQFDLEQPAQLLGDEEMFPIRSKQHVTVVFLVTVLSQLY